MGRLFFSLLLACLVACLLACLFLVVLLIYSISILAYVVFVNVLHGQLLLNRCKVTQGQKRKGEGGS